MLFGEIAQLSRLIDLNTPFSKTSQVFETCEVLMQGRTNGGIYSENWHYLFVNQKKIERKMT